MPVILMVFVFKQIKLVKAHAQVISKGTSAYVSLAYSWSSEEASLAEGKLLYSVSIYKATLIS